MNVSKPLFHNTCETKISCQSTFHNVACGHSHVEVNAFLVSFGCFMYLFLPLYIFLLYLITRTPSTSTTRQHVRGKLLSRSQIWSFSFLTEQAVVNENYAAVSQASREWLGNTCELEEKEKRMLKKGDFAYLSALNTPDCGLEDFRVFCDWVDWVFAFVEFFDDGELRDDVGGARTLFNNP